MIGPDRVHLPAEVAPGSASAVLGIAMHFSATANQPLVTHQSRFREPCIVGALISASV